LLFDNPSQTGCIEQTIECALGHVVPTYAVVSECIESDGSGADHGQQVGHDPCAVPA
jgi:hypothetical protein